MVSLSPEKLTQFSADIDALKSKLTKDVTLDDYHGFKRIIWLNRLFLLIGLILAPFGINPVSMICLSLYLTCNWCIIAHHVLHGAFNKLEGTNALYKSKNYAKGWRRFYDWNDWIEPGAWRMEHNILHHFYTNEAKDPDRISDAISFGPFRNKAMRFFILLLFTLIWKPFYYALTTFQAKVEKDKFSHKTKAIRFLGIALVYSYVPYIFLNFIVLPALFFPLGIEAVSFVLINRLGAELITNVHTFFIIVPTHAGDDVYKFQDHSGDKKEYYLRQLLSSSNYRSPNLVTDLFFGYLNYQIEHHLFPSLPPSKLKQCSAEVKKICQKYGVPYLEHKWQYRIMQMFREVLGKA